MKTLQVMKNKALRFLYTGLILVSMFCALVFMVQIVSMNQLGKLAIRELGVTYMSGMSKQVAAHFGTLIELRLSQVESLADTSQTGHSSDDQTQMQAELARNARSAGFENLALYTEDRQFQMVYGSQVTPDIPESLHRSVQGGKHNVCAGKDADGNPVVLMGVPAVHPTADGNMSIALVAGFPLSYLNNMLRSNLENNTVEYSIIRSDGSYVLRGDDADEPNYFERIEKHYETYDEKDPAQYAKELREALERGTDYASEIMVSGERWHVYCTSLPNSEWVLLLRIPHSSLDAIISLLQSRWTYVSLGGFALIVCSLFLVFVGYYRLTREQVRELNEARKSAERSDRAKNEFLSNMSHDIRTPMNGIMGMTTIAIENIDNPPRVHSCLKRISLSSRHLLGLINDMLDMSKIGSEMLTLHMEPVSLQEIAQNIMTIIHPMAQEKHQRFNIYIHDVRFDYVISDRVRLSQILLNILGNATKYTPEGGTIELNLYEKPSPKGDAYIRSVLYISDSGIGMPQEFIERIFEPFSMADYSRAESMGAGNGGGGMGMAITKHIIDSMGGTITVKSEDGKGSEFCITIDMEKADDQNQMPPLPNRNVLVVDHNAAAAEIALSCLQSFGLSPEAASTAPKALEMIEERQDRGEDYHLVLLAFDMPDMPGVQLAGEIRRLFGNSFPIILLTDGDWDDLETDARNAGVDGFLSKPLFRSSLYYGLRPFVKDDSSSPQFEEGALSAGTGDDDSALDGRRILVAEDNELNWEIVSEMLPSFGLEMDWAPNGKICVEKFSQSEDGWYDAILMDLRMPVMTGFEAAQAIRAMDRKDARKIPIIALSADAFAEDIQKCLDSGMTAHSAKPLDLPEIIGLLEKYIFV